jgi:hypothetical protein
MRIWRGLDNKHWLCVYGQNVTMAMILMMNQASVSHDPIFPAIITGIACVAVGFLPILGIIGTTTPVAVHFAAMSVSVGFGIMLGAFGTRARGHWGAWTIAGPGAVAIILLGFLEYRLQPGVAKFGRIESSAG